MNNDIRFATMVEKLNEMSDIDPIPSDETSELSKLPNILQERIRKQLLEDMYGDWEEEEI